MRTISYRLSAAYRRRCLLETGADPGETATLTFDRADVSPGARQAWVDLMGLTTSGELPGLPRWHAFARKIQQDGELPEFDQTYDTWEALHAAYAALRAEAMASAHDQEAKHQQAQEEERMRQDHLLAAYAEHLRGIAAKAADESLSLDERREHIHTARTAPTRHTTDDPARWEEIEAARRERQVLTAHVEALAAAEKQRLKEARAADQSAWIAAHGSTHLRPCLQAGYNCQRLYVLERAALEHPDYVVDYHDTSEWNVRSGPSAAALDEAARGNGQIVWLTALPSNGVTRREEWEDTTVGCEAVVIRAYLGTYDLVRIIMEP